MNQFCEKCGHDKSLHMESVPVTGEDLKNYRRTLRQNVDSFAGKFGTTRQNIARLERLTRPLTSEEFLSINPTRFVVLVPKAR